MNSNDKRKMIETVVDVIYNLNDEMRMAFADFYEHNRTCEECIKNKPEAKGSVLPFIGEVDDMQRIMHNWIDTMCDTGKELGRKIAPNYKG